MRKFIQTGLAVALGTMLYAGAAQAANIIQSVTIRDFLGVGSASILEEQHTLTLRLILVV